MPTKQKKFRKTIKLIRDIITILGIPAIGVLGWKMHNEQLNLKNEQINLKDYVIAAKEAEIRLLEMTQSTSILETYEKEKEFFEERHKFMSDSLRNSNELIDSLIKTNGVSVLGFLKEGLSPEEIKSFYSAKEKLAAAKLFYHADSLAPVDAYVAKIKYLNFVYSGENDRSRNDRNEPNGIFEAMLEKEPDAGNAEDSKNNKKDKY